MTDEASTNIALANELYEAARKLHQVAPIRSRAREIGIDAAYEISLHQLQRRLSDGERVIGKKIGVTSKPVQDMLGVREPDFGFLTDRMLIPSGTMIPVAERLIAPRIEAEIALILGSPLAGPGVRPMDVLAATQSLVPCFEIVDSRITDWNISIVDTVADNASCGLFVLGPRRVAPAALDLAALRVKVWKSGALLSEGVGAATLGSPLNAVAWLANTLGRYGVSLGAGDVVLSGSLVPLEQVKAGDRFRMELESVGSAEVAFS
jgi:2-oxopent-4-enoate/cis-2-oxohex-4-enoate hydratase